MEIQFLGTSSGTPTRSRNLSALALRAEASRQWCLIDCGEATQHRILRTSLSLMTLRAVFITHIHGDHCYGLPGLLASAGMLNRSETLSVIGPPSIGRFIDCVLETTGLHLPYPLQFISVEALVDTQPLPDLAVRATALSHRVPSYAYSFCEKAVEGKLDVDKLRRDAVPAGPGWGRIQQGRELTLPDGRTIHARDYLLAPRKPRKIIVGGDNDSPGLLAAEAADADVLVHEATYTQAGLDKVGPGPQHSSAGAVARFAGEAGIRNLVLTHFSPRYQEQDTARNGAPTLADLEAEARAGYQGRLFLASDLDRYALDRQGDLARLP
ncbi:MBL fold metallo-hydrolase [Noviherbaspirillum soli]|uniref:MBL fold metallo-hydrolase n=1 Tax=Noviherbaspirillum soli TaxID=1064518 RepID=UPI00188AB2D5|nr:MBL fold metallo-hydrolase [Noviherbaspirillum soli]